MVAWTPDSGDLLGEHRALVTLHPDGMAQADFISADAADVAATTLASGHGEWRESEAGIVLDLVVLASDAQRRFAGTGAISAAAQLDAAGTAFGGTFEFALTAADGQALGEGSGTMSGQFVALQP
jgi:hypothetical protein